MAAHALVSPRMVLAGGLTVVRVWRRACICTGVGWKIPTLAAILATAGLAVAGGAVGLIIHGSTGALLGVIPGALAGIVAGYIPAIHDRAVERRARQADARRALAATSEPLDDSSPGPAALLRPEQAIVSFTGRAAELDLLRDWCAPGPDRAVRVITGAGGVGKTRLARHAAAQLQPAGGTWQFVAAGQEASAVTAARATTAGPVLLIVDYAETRADLGQLLSAALADPGPLRILLLARSLGEWWDRLAEESAYAAARLLTRDPPIRLAAPITGTAPTPSSPPPPSPVSLPPSASPRRRTSSSTCPASGYPCLSCTPPRLSPCCAPPPDPTRPGRSE